MANPHRLTQSPFGWAFYLVGVFSAAVAMLSDDFVRVMARDGNVVSFIAFAALFAAVPVALSGSTGGRQSAAALAKGLVPLTIILFIHVFDGLFEPGEVPATVAVIAFGASVFAARLWDTAEVG